MGQLVTKVLVSRESPDTFSFFCCFAATQFKLARQLYWHQEHTQIDQKKPLAPLGFLFTMLLDQTLEEKDSPRNLYQVLRGEPSSCGFLIREHRK